MQYILFMTTRILINKPQNFWQNRPKKNLFNHFGYKLFAKTKFVYSIYTVVKFANITLIKKNNT